jgi:hypothetical protein
VWLEREKIGEEPLIVIKILIMSTIFSWFNKNRHAF